MTLPRRFRAAALACATLLTLPLASAAQAQASPAGQAQASPAGCVGKPSSTWINIVAEGMRNGNGLLAITPYPDVQSRFLVRHGSLGVERVPATAGTTRACLFVPKPGVYAIALYHDENADRHLDRTGIGLPAEGYGFSNNPPTLAGLPSFRSVRLNVPRTGLTTRIQMKYP